MLFDFLILYWIIGINFIMGLWDINIGVLLNELVLVFLK